MKMDIGSNLDPYVLLITFVLGAACSFFYIQSLPNSEWHKYRQTYNEHKKLIESEQKQSQSQSQQQHSTNIEKNTSNQSNPNSSQTSSNSPTTSNTQSISSSHSTTSNTSHTSQSTSNTNKSKPVRIYVDGCWDLCHSGHYNAIRQAKSLGDYLVVGVHSSEEIARNKRWPVMNDKERLACVRACKWVDQVVFDVPYSPSLEILDRSDINCDYVAHGDDIAINATTGKSAYADVEHRLKIFKRTPGVSTTALIDRLMNAINYEKMIENIESKEDIKHLENGKNNNITKPQNTNLILNKINQISAPSWSQFLSSSFRISAFSNSKTPQTNDKVIYIDGVFDLFHAGHIAALKEAKLHGTFLYVGLFDDAVVRDKLGKYYPLMNIQERTLNVLSCKYVDEVIIGSPWNIDKDVINVLNIEKVITTNITNELCNNNDNRFDYIKSQNKFLEIEVKESSLTTKKLMERIAKDQERIEKENENRVQKEMAYLQTRKFVEEA